MGLISKNKTWSDNENVLYTDLNGDFNTIYNEFNGNIDDTNIKNGAAITFAKLDSATVASVATTQTLSAKTFQDPLFLGTWDGWVGITDVVTFVSSNSVTLPGDFSTRFAVGDKIKLTQTIGGIATVLYFSITQVTYASPTTTLAINGGTDYVLSNLTITSVAYSKVDSPVGFPTYFNYDATLTAGGGSKGTYAESESVAMFKITGRSCYVYIHKKISDVGSYSGIASLGLPVTARANVISPGTMNAVVIANNTIAPKAIGRVNSGNPTLTFTPAMYTIDFVWSSFAVDDFILVDIEFPI